MSGHIDFLAGGFKYVHVHPFQLGEMLKNMVPSMFFNRLGTTQTGTTPLPWKKPRYGEQTVPVAIEIKDGDPMIGRFELSEGGDFRAWALNRCEIGEIEVDRIISWLLLTLNKPNKN